MWFGELRAGRNIGRPAAPPGTAVEQQAPAVTDEQAITALLGHHVAVMNAQDIDGFLDNMCVEGRALMQGQIDIGELGPDSFTRTAEIREIESVDLDGDTGVAVVAMTYIERDGAREDATVEIPVARESDRWLVCP